MPSWWDKAPAWEHREVNEHYDPETDQLTSNHIDGSLSLEEAHRRRRRGEPLEYILGHCHVGDILLKTDSRALVPRPETETMFRRFLDAEPELPTGALVDVGTGTGLMAGALSENTNRVVVATDVSPPALELARENRNLNGWNYHLIRNDRLRGVTDAAGVVANLPYVRPDSDRLADAVESHEPPEALFPDGNLESFYCEFIVQCADILRPGGEAWLELEPELLLETEPLIANAGSWQTRTVLRDEADRRRFLRLIRL